MKYVSLFAGIGGFDLALNRLGHTCVYANEWDKYAADTYQQNFGHRPDTRDITTIPVSDIPDHDLLCGGFPCQSFSVAGKRLGFADTRGTLFFDVARILKAKYPRYCILENVKGLTNHDGGRTFKTILATITELGYDCQWQVCNSKDFGVPQNRERIFIVGNLRGEPFPEVFPLTRAVTKASQSGSDEQQRTQVVGISQTLAGNAGGQGGKTGLYQISKTIRSGGRESPHGSKQNWDSYEVEGRIRRLTPIECERLQGFPDNWTQGVSDTQRYKQLGNAVTVNVVEEVVKRLWIA